MDVENVEQLLNYIFTDEDFDDIPSIKEFKKLKRVMHVMVGFYERGRNSKKAQYDLTLEELSKVDENIEMIKAQIGSLSAFPAFHPKRTEYITQLETELEQSVNWKNEYLEKSTQYKRLYEWSCKIVDTVTWLEGNLVYYANQILATSLDVEPLRITTEEFKIYKRGLDEITYNLQESQDFFDASLDGRLKQFHQLATCMVEAQLKVLEKFPSSNDRRIHIEGELKADLEYSRKHMQDDDKVRSHREKMRAFHHDFFLVLKWQRERMAKILDDEPEIIIGDFEQLKKDIAEREAQFAAQAPNFPVKGDTAPEEKAPEVASAAVLSGGKCPVDHGGAPEDGHIHRLYEPVTVGPLHD